jgi:Peptidase inhibitor family I36
MVKMIRGKRLAIALAGVMLVGVMGLATPAQASTDVFTQCPNGTSCVWTEHDGTGIRYTISVGANGVNVCHNLPGALDNAATSILDGYGSYAGHKLDLDLYSTYNCATPAALFWFPPADFGQWNFDVSPYTFHNNVHSSFIIGFRD